MTLKFLGTGTSQGVPVIGSDDALARSKDPRDKRLRTSALITTDDEKKILIDCGPDFRQQMLANGEGHVDAVLVTHEHNDHIIGLDDLRPIIFRNKKAMPLYTMPRVAKEISQRFSYAFSEERYPGAPSFDLRTIEGKFEVEGAEILPVEVVHGRLPILGYRIKDLAYITDASYISGESKRLLQNLEVLIINCLRAEKEHPSHFILPEIKLLVDELCPGMTYLTHISSGFGLHEDILKIMPPNIEPAYDGLEIKF